MTENTTSGLAIEGRIEKRVHTKADLQDAADNYDELSIQEKLSLAEDVEPAEEEIVYNATTEEMHKYFVRNLDPDYTSAADNVTAAWFAVGTDSTSGTAVTDTDLNTRVFEKEVTDHADNIGSSPFELVASTFLASDEANGNTLNELGLFTGDPANLGNSEVFLLNHATFADVVKDSTKTLTFNVTLTFSDV